MEQKHGNHHSLYLVEAKGWWRLHELDHGNINDEVYGV
jgi:hypothetical protein